MILFCVYSYLLFLVDWGMNGYIKMAIESFNKSNEGQCGIYKALSTAITI